MSRVRVAGSKAAGDKDTQQAAVTRIVTDLPLQAGDIRSMLKNLHHRIVCLENAE